MNAQEAYQPKTAVFDPPGRRRTPPPRTSWHWLGSKRQGARGLTILNPWDSLQACRPFSIPSILWSILSAFVTLLSRLAERKSLHLRR